MNKDELLVKLDDLGIDSVNAYPKKSFPHLGEIVVGIYPREMKEDFYFYNIYSKKIHKLDVSKWGVEDFEVDEVTEKLLVPLRHCEDVWEDKPFVEKLDLPYRDMSLRHYACIQLGVPDSGLPWLDELIKKK